MPQSLEERESPFQHIANSNENSNCEKKPRGRRPDIDGDWAPAFIGALMEGSTINRAARVAGVDVTMPYKRRLTDEEFKRAWQEAGEIGTEFLEQEAARRAFHGTLKPVFHKGERCGYVREYSDTLMIFLLKARRPDKYREGVEDGSGRGNITLNVSVVNTERIEATPEVVLVNAPAIGVEVVSGGEDGGQDDPRLPEADAVPRE